MCYTELVLSEVSVMNIVSSLSKLKVVFHLQEFVDNLVTEEELPESEREKFMVNTFAHNYFKHGLLRVAMLPLSGFWRLWLLILNAIVFALLYTISGLPLTAVMWCNQAFLKEAVNKERKKVREVSL